MNEDPVILRLMEDKKMMSNRDYTTRLRRELIKLYPIKKAPNRLSIRDLETLIQMKYRRIPKKTEEELLEIKEKRHRLHSRYKQLDQEYRNHCRFRKGDHFNFSRNAPNEIKDPDCDLALKCHNIAANIANLRYNTCALDWDTCDGEHLAQVFRLKTNAPFLRRLYDRNCQYRLNRDRNKFLPLHQNINNMWLDIERGDGAVRFDKPKAKARSRFGKKRAPKKSPKKSSRGSSKGSSKKKERIVSITVSKREHKKYTAKVKNLSTGKIRQIHFGDNRYQQFKDSTKIKKYARKNHGDARRRQNYFSRHSGFKTKQKAVAHEWKKSKGKYTPKLLSHIYLW